jgi:hypothetical protein
VEHPQAGMGGLPPLTILEWWMMTLSQTTATSGAAGSAASSCSQNPQKLALIALWVT